MATNKATASTHLRLLLLVAILLVVASVQARGDSMLPTPAMAPSPAACGLCPPDKIAELGVCFESSPLGGIRLPRTLDGLRRCCRQIRAQIGPILAGEKVNSGYVTRAGRAARDVIDGVSNGVGDVIDGFGEGVGDVIDGIGNGVDDVIGGLDLSADELVRSAGFGSSRRGWFVRQSPSADTAQCLCGAFSDSTDPARIANNINTVLTICGEPLVRGLACCRSSGSS